MSIEIKLANGKQAINLNGQEASNFFRSGGASIENPKPKKKKNRKKAAPKKSAEAKAEVDAQTKPEFEKFKRKRKVGDGHKKRTLRDKRG